MFLFVTYLQIIVSVIMFINLIRLRYLPAGLLAINVLMVLFYRYTNIAPVFILIRNNIYLDIIYIIINILLILGSFEIDDNLKSIHRILVSITLALSSISTIIL